MARLSLRALVAGAPLGLAACARTPVVSYNVAIPPPTPSEIRQYSAGRDVPVAVIGSPFPDITPRQLAAVIVTEMPSVYGARFYPVDALSPAQVGTVSRRSAARAGR